MSIADDDRPKKQVNSHEVGCDLSSLSVEDLDQRIDLLQNEITRLQADREKKSAGRSAAESLFRL
ncbi:DUF1192 domain-containing protein [Rhizobium halophilum]|uniref:DUF1192 domain-containing protein n=1 Tax=Rhizobium halophilum TaxID=2846852 RepID=UPI001EFD3BA8|nr:DUF1192 domain-containing protein [Rhizobium halophilum]MCF6367747.1 DUF1192 domain-containing protein [Rhizobium halophilum]